MKSKLVITYTATCECFQRFVFRDEEYRCPKCTCEVICTVNEVCEQESKYAVGPEPGYFTHGPYDTEEEALSIYAGNGNTLLCEITKTGYLVLYFCEKKQWIRC